MRLTLVRNIYLLIIMLFVWVKLPRFDGHEVKVYNTFMEVSQWNEDVNMTVSSRLKRSV